MPQFEFETPDGGSRLLRARDPEDAIRRAGLADATIAADEDLQGWRTVSASGAEVGRVREHQRMRFRRD